MKNGYNIINNLPERNQNHLSLEHKKPEIFFINHKIHFIEAEIRRCEVYKIGIVVAILSSDGKVYELIRTLRKCVYGKVKHAVRLKMHPIYNGLFIRTNEEIAIKIMSKVVISEGILYENPMIELATQQYLSEPGHPHVLTLISCLEDSQYIYALLPFCDGGELFTLVEQHGAMKEDVARHWFKQILNGLHYLHSKQICHRDMSLENVLLAGDESKIIDFGLAMGVPVDENGICTALPPSGAVGKIFYMAPEIYHNEIPFYGFAADIWSLGIMLFIMVTGAPPFERPDELDPRYQMVITGRLSIMLDSWGMYHVSNSVRDLISKMLIANEPGKRYTIEQISQHPWFVANS